MIEVGQLRVWKKQPHGGQFYNIPDGTLLLVTACEDNYVGNGNPAAVRKYTVLQDSETLGS